LDRITPERLEALLAAIARVHVVVVGDLMLDMYLRGAASRISPEAPVPVVRVQEEWVALGGAANVAANVVALGATCSVAGCVGPDAAGTRLRLALEDSGIDASGVITTPDRPTTVKTRILARHQQVARYDHESDADLPAESVASLVAQVRRLLASADVVAVEDYNKGVLMPPVIDAALGRPDSHDRPVIVDPKSRFFFDFAGATVFKPNLAELSAALREPVRFDDAPWLSETRRKVKSRNLLLTLGEDGMALLGEDDRLLRVPAVARSVYDVSGAGDTVTAVVAVSLAAGASAEEAAVLANYAAGVEVGKAGVATVSPDELRRALDEHLAPAKPPART
jgi:D-glycero-beta-D-manno-heptose-7-phosphate kinase